MLLFTLHGFPASIVTGISSFVACLVRRRGRTAPNSEGFSTGITAAGITAFRGVLLFTLYGFQASRVVGISIFVACLAKYRGETTRNAEGSSAGITSAGITDFRVGQQQAFA